MKISSFLYICIGCIWTTICVGQTYTIDGYVYEKNSNETLIGATVLRLPSNQGTITNEYGHFSMQVPKGKHQLVASYVGYEPDTFFVEIKTNTPIHFHLTPSTLEAVVISEKNNRPAGDLIGTNSLPMEQIKKVPSLMGETDVLKVLSLLPGVSTGAEGTAGIHVRGGTPDQNLMLLDGSTVYNAAHLLGFVSVFNADAIKKVELIKGGFPARYGGRLSSVVDISMKEGNATEHKAELTVGLISSKILLEGPITFSKWKASYMFSSRASYLGLLALPTAYTYKNAPTATYFNYWLYDVNGKVNVEISPKEKLFVSFYNGLDDYLLKDKRINQFEDQNNTRWGNITGSVRYTNIIRPNLFFASHFTTNNYTYHFRIGTKKLQTAQQTQEEAIKVHNYSLVRDLSLKNDFLWTINPNQSLRMGIEATYHRFKPNVIEVSDDSHPEQIVKDTAKFTPALAIAPYAEWNWRLDEKWNIAAHLRWSNFLVQQTRYQNLEPRMSVTYDVAPNSSIKASYSQMTQYLHLLTSSTAGLPNDLWVPVTKLIAPQKATQYAIGYAQKKPEWSTYASIEAFWKNTTGLIDYQEGVSPFSNAGKSWENIVEKGGVGKSYGIELLLHKEAGKFNGWIEYTLSWNKRRFDNINNGDWYFAKYDRRHDFGVTGSYQYNAHWSFSSSWIYSTGFTTTLPSSYFIDYFGNPNFYYNARNNYRFPAYHRLDLAGNYTSKRKSGREVQWSFGLYNSYARPNPYAIHSYILSLYQNPNDWVNSPQIGTGIGLEKKSLFGILPFVTYHIKLK
jgi:CarboxypepD_reg-like domain/TonB-dependent Receptor Plug Domain